jgi:hypothetical protein
MLPGPYMPADYGGGILGIADRCGMTMENVVGPYMPADYGGGILGIAD